MRSDSDAPAPVAVRALRLAFAVLGAVALTWIPLHGADAVVWGNYLGYFTVLSNVLAAIVLALGAVADPPGYRWQWFRGAVTAYMVITGIVYAALLADVDVGTQGRWANDVVHRILPLVLLADWVLWPSRRRIGDGAALAWLWFPAVYAGYTLARGAVVDWYPYPFLDPRGHGYLQMTFGLIALLIAMALICVAVNVAGRMGRRWRYGGRTAGARSGGVDTEVEE